MYTRLNIFEGIPEANKVHGLIMKKVSEYQPMIIPKNRRR